jgi:hypothetical protein
MSISTGCLHIPPGRCVIGFPKEEAPPERGFHSKIGRSQSDQVWQEVGRYDAGILVVLVPAGAVMTVAGVADEPQTQTTS